jgi:hypothetical protein
LSEEDSDDYGSDESFDWSCDKLYHNREWFPAQLYTFELYWLCNNYLYISTPQCILNALVIAVLSVQYQGLPGDVRDRAGACICKRPQNYPWVVVNSARKKKIWIA